MITFVQLIAEIVASMTESFTFLEGDKAEQNLGDDATFPIAYLGFPIESKDTMPKTGILITETPFEIYFAKLSKLDWTSEQHEVNCIAPMRTARKEFYVRCMKDKRIREIIPNKTLDVKNFLDVNTSGCLISGTIKLVDGSSICL